MSRCVNYAADRQDRNDDRFHACRNAGDHDGGRAGFTGFGQVFDRRAPGVILRHQADNDTADGATEDGAPYGRSDVRQGDDEIGSDNKQDRGADGADTQGNLGRFA